MFAPGHTKNILVVDDEVQLRRRMSELLRGAGYSVIESRDYQEAKALYERCRDQIDMLLIDVSLPGYYGCELARLALSINPSLRVLLISGHAGSAVCRFYGISATDVHFMEKPFTDERLLARIELLLAA